MFLGLRFKREVDLADTRPNAKGAEIDPGYKAKKYQSDDKSARVGGLSFAIDGGRIVMDLGKVRQIIFDDPITPEERKRMPADDPRRSKQDRGALLVAACGRLIALKRCGARDVVFCREGCVSTGDAWIRVERDVYDGVLEACNVARCYVVTGAPAEVTAAAVASKHPKCVTDVLDHSDGAAASDDGLTTEFDCEAACAAGFRDPKKVKTGDASLHVVTFSHDGEKIGPDRALVLCAFLLRDAEARHKWRWSLVSLAARVHSDSLKRLNNHEKKKAHAARTKPARAARAAVVIVCASALRACRDPVAEVRSMLVERATAVDVTSSLPPFSADLRGDAALAWLRAFIRALPAPPTAQPSNALNTAEKTLSYLDGVVAARHAAAEYVRGTDVFAPFDGLPDENGLLDALRRYDVKRGEAKLIAARTCEAVRQRQLTIPSLFESASAAHPQAASGDRATHSSPPSQDESLRVDAHIEVVGLPEYNRWHGVVLELVPRERVRVRVRGLELTLKRANVVLARPRPPQPPQSAGQSKKKKKKKKKVKPATASEAADFFSGKVRDAKPSKKKTRKK